MKCLSCKNKSTLTNLKYCDACRSKTTKLPFCAMIDCNNSRVHSPIECICTHHYNKWSSSNLFFSDWAERRYRKG